MLLSYTPSGCRLDGVNGLKKGLSGGGEVGGHSCCVVRLAILRRCEEFAEGMEDGAAEVPEAFRRAEACECRAVDGAWIAGCFGGGCGWFG